MLLRDELRARGRPSRLETAWVRPAGPLVDAGLCAAGVAGALLTTADARAALAVLLVAFAALAGDVSGLAPFARLLTPRRATECVVSEPRPTTRADVRVRLIVTAPLDAPRAAFVHRLAPLERRARRLLRGHLSSPPAVLCAALLLLATLAGARVLGLDGDGWIGPVTLMPAVALILGAAGYLDLALASPAVPAPGAPPDAAAVAAAAAVALVAALDADPPAHVAVELVLTGAAQPGELGMRAYVGRRRRAARPRELAVLALGACPPGVLHHHRTEGALLPARLHPGLIALARQTGTPGIRRGRSAALVARRAGWPALGLSRSAEGERPGATTGSAQRPPSIGPQPSAEIVAHCIELVRALDRQI